MPIGMLYRVGAPLRETLCLCPIAVAGTREPSQWGRRLARELGRELARWGYTVVAGLARGVDEETALGALETGGRVVAVLPYLMEDKSLNPRAAWLLRVAASYNASASAVAENLVKDENRVKTWLAARNRIIARLATALVVPESRYKAHWGTRYAVEHALSAGRPVAVFEPRLKDDSAVVKAFRYFVSQGAVAVRSIDEALRIIKRSCTENANKSLATPK
jgi:DNA processing protein